tara:strand:+ start:686 stop:1177 length:492 start_codon:yes stop_codon:yes gene_type:complete
METKTHYRKIFKSDHLGSADLEEMIEEGKSLIFTIKEVKQELNVTVAGRKGNHNIAYFVEKIKPLVLNATNSKVVSRFANSVFVEDWKNVTIKLYIDANVKMKGEIVGGVRIEKVQPKITLPPFTEEQFDKAKKANATIEGIKKHYTITPEMEQKFKNYGTKK